MIASLLTACMVFCLLFKHVLYSAVSGAGRLRLIHICIIGVGWLDSSSEALNIAPALFV